MARVWVDEWQTICCGQPFEVGCRVEWQLVRPVDGDFLERVLGRGALGTIDFAEEHHGEPPDAMTRTGRIRAVQAVSWSYDEPPRDGVHHPTPGSGVLQTVQGSAEAAPAGKGRHMGWLVDVDLDPAPSA